MPVIVAKPPSPGDVKPDDASLAGARRNRRFVCEALDAHLDESSGIRTVDDLFAADAMRLTGEEIVDACAAFYRYEMHKKVPPNALGVDVQTPGDEDQVRFATDCNAVAFRRDRAIFSLSDRLDPLVRSAVERPRSSGSNRSSQANTGLPPVSESREAS